MSRHVAPERVALVRTAALDCLPGRPVGARPYRPVALATLGGLAVEILDLCDALADRTRERDEARHDVDGLLGILAALVGGDDLHVARAVRTAIIADRVARDALRIPALADGETT